MGGGSSIKISLIDGTVNQGTTVFHRQTCLGQQYGAPIKQYRIHEHLSSHFTVVEQNEEWDSIL
jgi:hypothetical protein